MVLGLLKVSASSIVAGNLRAFFLRCLKQARLSLALQLSEFKMEPLSFNVHTVVIFRILISVTPLVLLC